MTGSRPSAFTTGLKAGALADNPVARGGLRPDPSGGVGAGSDVELPGQDRARAAQYVQGFALATGPVERQRQQAPALLPPGVLGDVNVQIRNGFGWASEFQSRPGVQLDGVEAQLPQARAFCSRPVLLGEVGVRSTAPPAQRICQRRDRVGGGKCPGGSRTRRRSPMKVRIAPTAPSGGSAHRSSISVVSRTTRPPATMSLASTARCRGPLSGSVWPDVSHAVTDPRGGADRMLIRSGQSGIRR